MPFQFSKFISIDPMRHKGWMTRGLVKIKLEELGAVPTRPEGNEKFPDWGHRDPSLPLWDSYRSATAVLLKRIEEEHSDEILSLLMFALLDHLIDLNPEMAVEPELNVMTRIMDNSPAFRLPQVHGEWAYLDVTAWIYDESDPGSPLFLEV